MPLRLWLKGSDVEEYKDLTVGLRDFHAGGNQFILNGHPVNFRGTHIYAGPKLNERGEVIEYERNQSATPDIDEGTGATKRPSPSPTPRRKPNERR